VTAYPPGGAGVAPKNRDQNPAETTIAFAEIDTKHWVCVLAAVFSIWDAFLSLPR
jgi:hypothetical protein